MIHFRWITHLDTFSVIAQLHKMKPSTWKGNPLDDAPDAYKSRTLFLLRHHNSPAADNWLDDLPLHDNETMEKWVSLNRLLALARKAIYVDPTMRTVVDPGSPPGRVALSLLPKDRVIQWHADSGPYHERHIRFHVPLITNPLCQVQVHGEIVHMEVGSLWYFNHRAQHTATNFGRHARIHLVFEMPIVVASNDDVA